MVCINVNCRLPSRVARFQVSIACLEQPVATLSSEVCKQVNTNDTNFDFDILYAGQILKSNETLSQYNVQNQSTVYIVEKFSHPIAKNNAEEDEASAQYRGMVTLAIQEALLHRDYRGIVERMLTDPDTLENIIVTTNGLDKDPAVLAMLLEPKLLAILAHPNNFDSVMKHHPSFAQAVVTVASAVNTEIMKSGAKPSTGSVTYSMDQMSDEEDDQPGPSVPREPSGASHSITASQLAAALQTATGATAQFGASSAPSALQGAGNEFFQQAMAHAQTASSETALQQLREMGITEDNVARQALAATNGDIQAAIDLIFGDGFM